jgi:hypothetical protein
MRWFLSLLILLAFQARSQNADFIMLKKNGKTVKSFYAGTQIEFISVNGAYRNALIEKISNDSLFLREFIVNRVPTQLGVFITDTAGSYHYSYNYKDIASIGKKRKGFNLQASGGALLGGGILLTVASGVVYLADRSKFSPQLMIASVGLGGIGYLLTRIGRNGIVIGKHGYSLEYMNLTTSAH